MLGTPTFMAGMFANREMRSMMISNESEDTSGRTAAEIERTIYVRVTNFDFLERAIGAERQEQWSVKIEKTEENAGSGSIRVRKVTNLREPGAAIQYVLTSKLDVGTQGNCAETSEQSSLDQFNIFKYFANKGMLKDRYTFQIEGSDLVWEVDCFPKPGEMYFEWLKIDLEKWPSGKELPQLPFNIVEMIDGDEKQQSEESKNKISRLYEEVFLIPNTKDPLAKYAEPESEQPGVADDQANQNTDTPDGTNNDDDDGTGAGQDNDNAGSNQDGSEGADSPDAKGKAQGDDGGDQGAAGSSRKGDDDSSNDDATGNNARAS